MDYDQIFEDVCREVELEGGSLRYWLNHYSFIDGRIHVDDDCASFSEIENFRVPDF